MAGSGDCADLFVAQVVLFDFADDRARLVDSFGWKQRLRSELRRTALCGGPGRYGAGCGRWLRLLAAGCSDGRFER